MKGDALKEHQWKKGQSGNPGGRPKTRPFRDALLARMRKDDSAQALDDIASLLVEKARSGDHQAISLLIERLDGRSATMPVLSLDKQLFEMDSASALGAIADAVAGGQISPLEGQQMASLIESRMKAIEMAELEERLTELERAK